MKTQYHNSDNTEAQSSQVAVIDSAYSEDDISDRSDFMYKNIMDSEKFFIQRVK